MQQTVTLKFFTTLQPAAGSGAILTAPLIVSALLLQHLIMKTKRCSEGPGVTRPSNPEPEFSPIAAVVVVAAGAKIDCARRQTACFANF